MKSIISFDLGKVMVMGGGEKDVGMVWLEGVREIVVGRELYEKKSKLYSE